MSIARLSGAVLALSVIAACDSGAPVPPSVELTGGLDAAAGRVASDSEGEAGGFAAEVVVAPEAVAAPSPVSPSDGAGLGLVRAGVLTAGAIDDGLNFAAFRGYLGRAQDATGLPLSNFAAPVLLQILGPDGQPAAHQRVTVRSPGAETAFFDGYSGTNGLLNVFPAVLGAGAPGQVEVRLYPEDQADPVVRTVATGTTRHSLQLPSAPAAGPGFLDLVFVVDATGSMGDELAWLTRDLQSIVTAATRGAGDVDIRYGLVVYRDQGDEYVVRAWPMMDGAGAMRRALADQEAAGGGDYPEAAADAMAAAAGLSWRRGQGERLLFHIADAPPHDADAGRYLAAARQLAGDNVQIFGLGASGVADASEFLMRQAAAFSGGQYLFLTDDSGVGLSHEEPRVSCYQVTELRDLMIRTIRSELTGIRVEPAAGEVIRTVGTYRNGQCID
jgi:hypothetical protein